MFLYTVVPVPNPRQTQSNHKPVNSKQDIESVRYPSYWYIHDCNLFHFGVTQNTCMCICVYYDILYIPLCTTLLLCFCYSVLKSFPCSLPSRPCFKTNILICDLHVLIPNWQFFLLSKCLIKKKKVEVEELPVGCERLCFQPPK